MKFSSSTRNSGYVATIAQMFAAALPREERGFRCPLLTSTVKLVNVNKSRNTKEEK
jgi:hypothetical protein